ncbi:hypothetical protein KTC96_23875 (plasmid) [Clostridium estertheticum]|uniref:DUF6773 family protein n=1 Tax=Clostridium estertheticum TaxID=238834 RepID=UPI001C7CF7D0|nr:DUF6773 family protein [Clostridium estertheticum]MBX4262189.1 hypothetical protein [Clostridium estertheticum]WLC73170.1 hypothetical protein KTC96_23875 [Clostridium estertheticum]
MKNKLIHDERAVAQKRKIGNEACNLLLSGLGISLLIKAYVLNVPFSQYTTELLCLLGASIYIVIRNIIAGNNVYETKGNGKKSVVLISLVVGLAVCISAGITNHARYGDKYTDVRFFLITLAMLFVSGTVLTLLIASPIYKLNRKRQKKIADELDKEENDIK